MVAGRLRHTVIETRAVALAVRRGERVLTVRRPDDDPDLPGRWGLPATTAAPDESWRAAARRVGPAKLGADAALEEVLNEGRAAREAGTLRMRLFGATLDGDPACPQPGAGTQYVDWRWADPTVLRPAAAAGSLCSALVLDSAGVAFECPEEVTVDG